MGCKTLSLIWTSLLDKLSRNAAPNFMSTYLGIGKNQCSGSHYSMMNTYLYLTKVNVHRTLPKLLQERLHQVLLRCSSTLARGSKGTRGEPSTLPPIKSKPWQTNVTECQGIAMIVYLSSSPCKKVLHWSKFMLWLKLLSKIISEIALPLN